jgi:hypothetical protein
VCGLVDEFPKYGIVALAVEEGLVDEAERVVEGFHDVCDLGGGVLDELFDVAAFELDALLFLGEHFVVDEGLCCEVG